MTKKIELRALMSIKATDGREAIPRGETFSARDAQEARDLLRMKQAERVEATAPAPKSGKA